MADIAAFLKEISPDLPCGENLEYDNARTALDVYILGKGEDLITGAKAEPPNWREVQKESLALLHKSKDLQVILYLIRALIRLEGIQGFRDGLSLLEQCLNLFWEEIHPQLDPDDGLDPTLRVNIIEELVNSDFVLQPLSLEMLVESRSVGRFSLRDYQYAIDKFPVPDNVSKPDVGTIRAAFLDVEQEAIENNHQSILDSIKLVSSIEATITEKVGSSSGANLDALKSFLKELRYTFEQLAGSRLSANIEQALTERGEVVDNMLGQPSIMTQSIAAQPIISGRLTSRHDVTKALDAICKYYAEYEPSSPVPILLERAKYLVAADFMAIVHNLLPDAINQLEVIKGPDPNQSSDY